MNGNCCHFLPEVKSWRGFHGKLLPSPSQDFHHGQAFATCGRRPEKRRLR